MIKSIDYKLIKQPGTISEELFFPNENLLKFFKENKNNSRILAIKASNSSGKSFLLNSIANSFNALDLPQEELSPTLRRSITFLADKNHQKIDFEIDIEDPDGYNIKSNFNHEKSEILFSSLDNNTSNQLSPTEFAQKYKLLYDIPEKPLDRIYKLLKEVKDFNTSILGKLDPLYQNLAKVSRSLKEVRNENVIEELEKRIDDKNKALIVYRGNKKGIENNLTNLNIVANLAKLNQSVLKLEADNIIYETIKKDLKILIPPAKQSTAEKDKKDIKLLKTQIRELRVENLLKYCLDEINDSDYFEKFNENLSNNDKGIFDKIFTNLEFITNSLLICDEEKITSIIWDINTFVSVSLGNVFRGIKGDYDESEYAIIKDLKKTIIKHKELNKESDILEGLFLKSTDEVLNELNEFEKKFEKLNNIKSLQSEVTNTLKKVSSRIKEGHKYSKKLYKLANKSNAKLNNLYTLKKDKLESIIVSRTKIEKNIYILKKELIENGVSQIEIESKEKIQVALERFFVINKYCNGLEKEQIQKLEREIKELDIKVTNAENKIIEDGVKLTVECAKTTSEFTIYNRKIQMYINKLTHFTKYITQRNSLISNEGELEVNIDVVKNSYIKILGQYVASLMGNKIIYQDDIIDIEYIDYTSSTPYFVTPGNRKIAFSDFSGGQGSSNYLKAKLNLNEDKKYIVLIDEIANMDDQSLQFVIDRLKELDKNNKLLIAILAEPEKKPGVFNIKSY
jgi:hypothetical protein